MGAVDEIVIRVLGAPAVVGARRVAVRGARQVGLLALLATEAGRRVATHRLEDELWDGRVVSDAALRVTVNRLRQRFVEAGVDDPVRTRAGGYLLDLDPDRVDLLLLERLAAAAVEAYRSGRVDEVLSLTGDGLSLRTGRPFDGLAEVPTAAVAADRADRACADLAVCRAGVLIGRGRDQEAFDVLSDAVPLARHREDLVALQMVAADQLGRRDLAVSAFDRLAADLLDDVGIGPGHVIADLRAAVEDGDPGRRDRAALDLLPGTAPDRDAAVATIELAWWRPPSVPLVGRQDAAARISRAVGAGGVCLVEAEAGFGKTALVGSVVGSLVPERSRVLRVLGNRLDSGPATLLRALTGDVVPSGGRAPEERDAGGGTGVADDPDTARLRVHAAATEALRGAAPDLVVVEDLHWMDDDALGLLVDLVGGSGVPWVLTTRPTGPAGTVLGRFREDLRSQDRDRLVEVSLGPLTDAEVAELVSRRRGPDDDPVGTDLVVARAAGWPLLAVELSRHLDAGDGHLVLDDVPESIQRSVSTDVASLGPTERELVELVAVAGVPLSPEQLAGAAPPSDPVAAADVVGRLVASGLVRVEDGRLGPTHDVVRDAVVGSLDPARLAELHLRCAGLLDGDDVTVAGAVVRHLLAAGPAGLPELEARIGPFLVGLRRAAAFTGAADVVAEYLAAAGPVADSAVGMSARVEAAYALLSHGRADEGLALLDALDAQVRRLGDPVLLAAAMLARGPVDVGAADDRVVADALELRRRLPAGALELRVRLGCWAAHHCLTAGGPEPVDEILDECEWDAAASGDDELRAMVLGVRYQAATVCERGPEDGEAACAAVRRWASLTGRTATRAMAILFAVDRAATEGTLEDHRAAVADLEAVSREFPRPDLRWCVGAARAGAAVAAGDLDGAADLVMASSEQGRRLHVGMAEGVERLQQYLLLEARGLLPALAPLFDRSFDELGPPVMVAVAGRAALEAGDVDRAAAAASYLAGRPTLLVRAGAGWPVIAHAASELAAAVPSPTLGRLLLDEIGHRRGTALSTMGLVLLGSVERITGLASVAVGDLGTARVDLELAAARDRRAGMAHWADRAAAAAGQLGP